MVATTLELQPILRSRSLDAIDPNSLTRLTIRELDELFADLDLASLGELQGHKRGRVMAMSGFDWVPGIARSTVLRFVNQLPIWRGKNFEGEFGTNAWLLGGGRLQFARYLVREAPALDGRGMVIRLDYDVAANPRPLRRIVGELRHLGPGLFLARMQYLWGERVVKILYFTLES
jgi:hypothetical protein